MSQLIFVVDDDIESCELARHSLEHVGYSVRTFSTTDVMAEAESSRPSLILISLRMQDCDGISTCRRIRENPLLSMTSVIFLLEDATEEQRVLALESGGDDYLTKPLTTAGLIASVRAVLRRFSSADAIPRTGESQMVIDSSAMRLSVSGVDVPVTFLEFRLVDYLSRHQGQVLTRDVLLDAVWGDRRFVTPRSVDVCIRRVREKIEPNRAQPRYLKTVHGVGYRWDAMVGRQSASNEGCNCPACTRQMDVSDLACAEKTKGRRSAARD
jgi:DNA-binding response OmpR family regulator